MYFLCEHIEDLIFKKLLGSNESLRRDSRKNYESELHPSKTSVTRNKKVS